MANQESIISYLEKYLKEQQRANDTIADEMDRSVKNGIQVTEQQNKTFDLLTDRIEKLTDDLNILPNLAQTVSEKLGQEVSFTRELSHQVSMVFKEDRDLRTAYINADRETQSKILEMVKNEAKERLNLSGEMLEKYDFSINKALSNVERNIDDLIKKSENILFPMGINLMRTLDGFRHNIVEVFPRTLGAFFSDAMMEHYKTGLSEISGYFRSDISKILAPMDAIIGPFRAVSKSMLTIGKTLFSGPTKKEQETAKLLREIRDNIKGVRHDNRKTWLQDKKERFKDKANSIYEKGKDGLGKIFGWIMKLGPIIMSGLSVVGGFITGTLLPALPIIAAFVAAAASVGKIALNIFNDSGKLGDYIAKGDWASFGKLLGADIFDGLLMIPEMLVNAILSTFTDFRVDFGKEAILKFFDEANSVIFKWFTEPLFDVVDSITNFFVKIGDAFNAIKDSIMGSLNKVADFFGFGEDEVDKKPITTKESGENNIDKNIPIDKKPLAMKGLKRTQKETYISDELYVPGKPLSEKQKSALRMGKSMGNELPSGITEKDIAVAKQQQAQMKVTKEFNTKLDAVNNNITDNTQAQQILIQNIQNNRKEPEREIPTDTSDLGIMFNNAIYGA